MDKLPEQNAFDNPRLLGASQPHRGAEGDDRNNDASLLELLVRASDGSIRREAMDFRQVAGENARLQELLHAYQSALDQHAIVALTDRYGKIIFVNGRFRSISGYSTDELLGQSHKIVNSGYHPSAFFVEMWQTISSGAVWHGEICNRSKSGVLYWVDTTIVPIMNSQKKIEAYVSIRYDISRQKMVEGALREEVRMRRQAETLLLDVVETVPDAIAAFDTDDRLVMHNQAYLDTYKLSSEAIHIGATFESIIRHGLDNGQYVLSRNTPSARESWLNARLHDHRNPGKVSVQALAGGRWMQTNERRSPSGNTIGTRTDITELKRSEAAAKYHAEHDPLTNVFNRSVLEGRLEQAIENSRKNSACGALIIADFDGFKQINDTMGHAAGDFFLVTLARRMEATLKKTDTVVRLGGDEFAFILPHVVEADIGKLAAKLISAITQPLGYQKREIRPQVSLGICLFPHAGKTVQSIFRKADKALYEAKSEPGNASRVFTRSMHARHVHQRRQVAALTAAIASDRIDIALQPQFLLSDRSHTGFEALARWRHGGRQVGPTEFIPVAEQAGLIVDLGDRVLAKALKTIGAMKGRGIATGRVAVNIAAAQLRVPEFAARLMAMVTHHGLAPQDLELELTENILLDKEQEQIAGTVRTFRRMGFSVALDDFGTGYASLAHLSLFPVNKIKIDRSFVREMLVRQDVLTIVRGMSGLAHSLGMTVIAEGIETTEQLGELLSIGCDFGQGYLVSPPLDPTDLPDYLTGRSPTDLAA